MLDRQSRVSALCRGVVLLLALLAGFGTVSQAQSQGEKQTSSGSSPRAGVLISFLPPPLDGATYSLGIYEAKSGKLIRHLHEISAEAAFAVGVNGLITHWDGKNDSGQPAPPGRYAARGYAVGALQVEGTDLLGNDWVRGSDNPRIKHIEAIELDPSGDHLIVDAKMVGGLSEVLEQDGPDGVPRERDALHLGESAPDSSKQAPGKDHSLWKITDDSALIQEAPDGTVLRKLTAVPGDPPPTSVVASTAEDRLYLLEEKPGWQRVRGLSWVETKEEDGKQVSTWQTFFERNIRTPDAALGLENPGAPVEVNLIENPLAPGQPQKTRLAAGFDEKGSYLTTADGLRLRQISLRPNLTAAKLTKGKSAGSLAFLQTDGAAWDEFSIEGARNMMAFDAGEFEMTATGEKPLTEKAPEPPDL